MGITMKTLAMVLWGTVGAVIASAIFITFPVSGNAIVDMVRQLICCFAFSWVFIKIGVAVDKFTDSEANHD